MNTDEQVLDSGKDLTTMLACLLIKSCKKNDSLSAEKLVVLG